MRTLLTTRGNEVKVYAVTFEPEAEQQVRRLAEYPAYSNSKIRIMPDSHAGKGCTVGTTMTITDKVTPGLVGVDIGCGMLCVRLGDRQIDFQKLDEVIHQYVPSGKNIHSEELVNFDYDRFICRESVDFSRARLSIGTLGGGNHFIEVDWSEQDQCYYLVIHTGSRALGYQVCMHYQNLAIQALEALPDVGLEKERIIFSLKAAHREQEISSELERLEREHPKFCKELAHLEGESFENYMHDMAVTQKYASLNRATIAKVIISHMGWQEVSRFETIHNYIDMEHMVLRKGAVSAQKGEMLIIPINMRDGSLVCRGKGNSDWNCSAPHGAGRLMSRSAAKERVSMSEYEESMRGIFTTSVNQLTLDEAPQAYKSMEEISSAIVDTVDILDVIKPVYNFKAAEE